MEKKTGKLKKFIVGFFAVLGVLFVLIMLIPDDEEPEDEYAVTEEIKVTSDEGGKDDGKEDGKDNDEDDDEDDGKDNDEDDGKGDDEASGADVGGSAAETQQSGSAQTVSAQQTVDVIPVESDASSVTIMIYMNGSDLESESGEATTDISEMIASGIGKNVNVVIQTMGTKKWKDYGISSKTAQTYSIKNKKLKLVRDNLGQLDCTSADTLSEFIGFCKKKYPAERYIMLFWNHGGGPVYGFGYDEWQDEEDSLTIAEMAKAFSENKDVYFDMIGMDCCIMGSLETCYALAPYCKYALLSEDFESGLGWSYTGWMKALEKNPGMSTPLLGKNIIDDIIEDNESSSYGDSACMSLFNMSTIKNLYSAWKAYAYKNSEALGSKNYSKKHKAKRRTSRSGFWDYWGSDDSYVTLDDYYISDILALVESVDKKSDEAKELTSTLKAAVAYYGHTSEKNELTGLAVSLPYGDYDFYQKLKEVYTEIGLDKEYIDWLEGFVNSAGSNDYNDYSWFEDIWNGWGDYEDDYGCGSDYCMGDYAYDYDTGDYYGHDYEYSDDWIYDYQEDIWYMYEGDTLYMYDEESDTMYYYDEYEDEMYYYDDRSDDWCLMD